MFKKIYSSIKWQLSTAIILTAVIIISIGGYIYYRYEEDLAYQDLEKKGEIIADRLADNLKRPLWDFYHEQVNMILKREIIETGVLAISIEKTDGTLYKGFVKDSKGNIKEYSIVLNNLVESEEYLTIKKEIIFQDLNVGTLILKMTDRNLRKRINQQFFITFLIFISTISIALIVLILFVQKLILNPLLDIAGSLKKFSDKDLDIRLDSKYQNEFGVLSENFNNMAKKISGYSKEMEQLVEQRTKELVQHEKMASLGEMVAGVAHEINTPIGISYTASTHQRKKSKDIRKKFDEGKLTKTDFSDFILSVEDSMDIIQKNLYNASELIVSFKKVSSDRQSHVQREFNVKQYLEDIVVSLKPKFKTGNHIVNIECDESLSLNNYPGQFSQVITNLLINSVVHGFEDRQQGVITINAMSAQDGIQLFISDDGRGIEENEINKIYDPFYTTKRGKGGTGLGLNIVYNIIISQMKGQISCKSKVDEGTVFEIFIPDLDQQE